jgi:transposase
VAERPIQEDVGDSGECPRCRELERTIAIRDALHAQAIARVEARVRELEARLKLDSRNSSRPPSSDPPGVRPKPARRPGDRKAGGQPGHEGKCRPAFAPEQIDRTVEEHPGSCHLCGGHLRGAKRGALDPVRHQVVDVPAAPAEVTEYVLHRVLCPCCGVVTTAPLPAGTPSGAVGPRLQAIFALMVGRFRLSRREALEAIVALFGPKAEVSLGTLSALEGRTSAALAPAWEEARAAVRASAVAHADETSYGPGWLWMACTSDLSFFLVDPNRSRAACQRLLGEDFPGVIVTDRWASYHYHPFRRRQLCWAHLQRNAQELVDRGGSAVRVGRAVLRAADAVFSAWEDHRAGRLTVPSMARRLAPARRELSRALQRGRTNADRKAAALCNDLRKLFVSLWTFARRSGVEPTNNLAEREIRPAVLWRKGCFGAWCDAGRRFTERVLTVARTLRRKGRDILAYLEASIRARLAGKPAPRLLTA